MPSRLLEAMGKERGRATGTKMEIGPETQRELAALVTILVGDNSSPERRQAAERVAIEHFGQLADLCPLEIESLTNLQRAA